MGKVQGINGINSGITDRPTVINDSDISFNFNFYNKEDSGQQNVLLDLRCKQESMWWIKKLKLSKWMWLAQSAFQMIIQTDASLRLKGGNLFRRDHQRNLSYQEDKRQKRYLGLLTLKLVLLIFTKEKAVKSVYLQINNKAALRYLVKMKGDHEHKINRSR